MGTPPREFRYFLARPGGGAPVWIPLVQWLILVFWLLFSWWIFWGRGNLLLHASFVNFHGVFSDEVTLRVSVLPNWTLISLALLALSLWFQGLWIRCGVCITECGVGWEWRGMRGPREPRRILTAFGGAWLQEGGRWYFVPAGFVDGERRPWFSAVRASTGPRLHWRRVVSPLSLLLLLLLLGAYLAVAPAREYRRTRAAVYAAFARGDRASIEALVLAHPEFRPWARYLSTLPACDRVECLRSQITDRIEMISIGPSYGADDSTLIRLLILSGRSALALKLSNPGDGLAFDTLVRTGQLGKARSILDASPATAKKRGLSYLLLLLQEGRFKEADTWNRAHPSQESLDLVAVQAVIAEFNGDCFVAKLLADKLMRPDSLPQAAIVGEAPPTGLGALRRAVRAAKNKGCSALACAIVGDMKGARAFWAEASAITAQAGVPGAIDRTKILLDLVSPGGPWSPG